MAETDEEREDQLAAEAETEYFLQIPPLGEVYEFGPDKRKVQVTGLDWNDYNGELTIRLRTYSPAMTSSKIPNFGPGKVKEFSGLADVRYGHKVDE